MNSQENVFKTELSALKLRVTWDLETELHNLNANQINIIIIKQFNK